MDDKIRIIGWSMVAVLIYVHRRISDSKNVLQDKETLLLILGACIQFMINHEYTRYRKHHDRISYVGGFELDDNLISIILPYGPFIEGCAGNGKNSFKLRQHGIDSLAFDIYSYTDAKYGNINYGKNGTFEHKYPNRTLLLLYGAHTEESVLNYTGKTIIIGGNRYKVHISDGSTKSLYKCGSNLWREMDDADFTTPSHKWMLNHGWNCIGEHTSCNNEDIDYLIKIYTR